LVDSPAAGVPPHPIRPPAWFECDGLDHQEFSAGGIRTFAILEGRADAFPVVLLHGLPGASFLWRSILAGASRERRLIVPDLPGWGRSRSAFDRVPVLLTPDRAANWLINLLETQGVRKFDLVAHGISAAIGLEFSGLQPGRVRRLALIQPSPWCTHSRRFSARMALAFGGRQWTAQSVDKLLSDSLNIETTTIWRPFFRELLSDAAGASPPADLARVEREFASRAQAHREAWTKFRGLKLAVTGDRDSRFDARAEPELSSDASYHRLKAGRYPMLDAPDELRPILHNFWND
jgi:pimeloyl-ACP methyl ester carboxylesterase